MGRLMTKDIVIADYCNDVDDDYNICCLSVYNTSVCICYYFYTNSLNMC